MEIHVNRDSPVPLHDQLVAQLGQLVAAGVLAPGRRLPSIRGLASRLGVHHHTVLAAYRTLAERGVLTIREGSGVRVADLAPPTDGWREGVALRALAAHYVALARARGHADAAITAACEAALSPTPIRRLVVVNPHPDLQALYIHELGERIALPMTGATPAEVEAAGPAAFAEACLVTSTNFVAGLRAALGDGCAPVALRLRPADALLAHARALAPDAALALVSASERFVVNIGNLLASVLGDNRLHRATLADAGPAHGALQLGRLVVTDAASAAALAGRTRAPIVVHRLLADDALEPLVERLPPEAFKLPARGATP